MASSLLVSTGIEVALKGLAQLIKALKESGGKKSVEQLRGDIVKALEEIDATILDLDRRLKALEMEEARRKNRFWPRFWRFLTGKDKT